MPSQSEGVAQTRPRERKILGRREGDDWPDGPDPDERQPTGEQITSGEKKRGKAIVDNNKI